MFTPRPEDLALLEKLQANYRLVSQAQSMKLDETTKQIIPDPDQPGGTFCEIIDLATGEVYVKEPGENEPKALSNALAKAVTAPKPKTAAQKAHEEMNASREAQSAAAMASKDAEIARLRAELERLKGGGDGPSRDDLRAMLREKGVEYDGRANRETLLALAREHGLIT